MGHVEAPCNQGRHAHQSLGGVINPPGMFWACAAPEQQVTTPGHTWTCLGRDAPPACRAAAAGLAQSQSQARGHQSQVWLDRGGAPATLGKPRDGFREGWPEGNLPLGRMTGNMSSFPSCPMEAE